MGSDPVPDEIADEAVAALFIGAINPVIPNFEGFFIASAS